LHDWVGKRLRVPVWRLFGLDRAATPVSSMTIGLPPDDLDSPRDYLRQRVAEVAGQFEVLKVKVGTARDHEHLEAIRSAAPQVRLRLDANCGWSPEEAAERIRQVSRFGTEFVEQPIAAGQHAALRELRRTSPVPIFVDEDSLTPRDVLPLTGVVDGINIKLSKCGGIREALRMIHLARAAGLKIMLGCMVETSLGISAAAQLAALVDYVDLDGHLLLRDDPFAGLELHAGRVLPPDAPGLGVDASAAFASG
jgi:L-alanine-DL-glutamate epimerase-like enolase superfamily enzyme